MWSKPERSRLAGINRAGWVDTTAPEVRSMRQSRRTKTGNRRNTLARRYRPWLRAEPLTPVESTPQPPAPHSPALAATPAGAERPIVVDHLDDNA